MDVGLLRELLMEIGQQQYITIVDERGVVTRSKRVYTQNQNIHEVIAIYALDDYDRTNDLSAGGAHNGVSVEVTPVVNPGTEVLVSYVVREGLTDAVAQQIIDSTLIEVKADFHRPDIDLYNPDPNDFLANGLRVYWQMLALVNAYLMMNNVNFIMSDANISLYNYQTMSKLWGEGMSTDALFNRLFQRIEALRTKLILYTTGSEVYEGAPDAFGYWRDPSMFASWIRGNDYIFRNPN